MTKKKQTKVEDATEFQKSAIDNCFNLVKQEGKVFICLGQNCVSSKTFETFDDADAYIKQKPYELLINMVFGIIKFEKQNETNSTKN